MIFNYSYSIATEVYEESSSRYSHAYVRNDLTLNLYEIFDYKTDYKIISYETFVIKFKIIISAYIPEYFSC